MPVGKIGRRGSRTRENYNKPLVFSSVGPIPFRLRPSCIASLAISVFPLLPRSPTSCSGTSAPAAERRASIHRSTTTLYRNEDDDGDRTYVRRIRKHRTRQTRRVQLTEECIGRLQKRTIEPLGERAFWKKMWKPERGPTNIEEEQSSEYSKRGPETLFVDRSVGPVGNH